MDDQTVEAFHRAYYDSEVWKDTRWLGVETWKTPLDLWAYQEIIFETRPDLIVETGTNQGGSAYFMALVCQAIGKGRIVSVDLIGGRRRKHRYLDLATGMRERRHRRVDYLVGSSTDPAIVANVKRRAKGKRTMVILDSDHSEQHVTNELAAYADIVTPGCYLIVEDTNVNGHPVYREHGPGPMEALAAFNDARFTVDRSRERFGLTFNPTGYLLRV